MSWEVWTMPQKTSFCNGTLLRSDLRHFWPAGFVYVLIWLMILPIQLLRVGYDAPRGDGLLAENLEPLLHNVIVGASVGSLVLAVVCGVVIPMAVYAYLMTPRSVGMMHALPVKRTTQYFSHFLAGFGLLTAGNLLIFLLSVLAQLPFGMVDWAALGQWLLLTELLELFFLSLGALCAMVTGWLLAIPVLYVAVNFAALLLCSVVQFLQRWFYFGFQYTTYPPFVQWLTPIIKLAEDVGFLDGEYITRNGIEVYWRSLSAQALPHRRSTRRRDWCCWRWAGCCTASAPVRRRATPSPSRGCGSSSAGPWVCAAVWGWDCSSAASCWAAPAALQSCCSVRSSWDCCASWLPRCCCKRRSASSAGAGRSWRRWRQPWWR